MRNPHKALEAIERLVSGDFAMDMEWYLAKGTRFNQKSLAKNLKQAARIITDVYLIAHSENVRSCQHPEWEHKKYEVLATPEP